MKGEAGIYWGKLKEVSTGRAGKNNTPRLRLGFTVDLKASDGGDWDELDPPLVRSVDFFLTDAAIAWTEEKLVAIGFDGNYLEPTVQGFDPDLSNEGTQLECVIKGGEKPFESWQISKVESIRSDGLDPLPGMDLDRLAARYKQKQANTRTPTTPPGASAAIKATPPSQSQAPSAPPRPVPQDDAPVPEEDIPF